MDIQIQGIQILLAGLWIMLMLIYLLGDVLRIFSGDIKKMEKDMQQLRKFGQKGWLGISMLMLIPILMIFFSLALEPGLNRASNIIIAGFFFLFNIVGLPTYPGWYDRFLIAVGLGFNLLTIWYAWGWAV